MEDSLGVGLLALAALVMGIVALAKLSHLGASIEELKRRLSKLEGRDETPAPEPIATKSPVPPPLPSYVTQQPKVKTTTAAIPGSVPARPHQAFNWESILGVKLFAWIGGFAFFLGIVFFVKYAFDNNWITPAMRIVAGAIIGTLLIVVSLLPKVRRYHIPTQSVCATGILILYADVYSAHAFYGLISLTAASGLMWILTAVAVVLANYIAAQSIALACAHRRFCNSLFILESVRKCMGHFWLHRRNRLRGRRCSCAQEVDLSNSSCSDWFGYRRT